MGLERVHHAGHHALPAVSDGRGFAYNWWSLLVRLANPTAQLEVITSGMARKTRHAGQQHLTIVPMHENGAQGTGQLTQVSQLDEGTNTYCEAIA